MARPDFHDGALIPNYMETRKSTEEKERMKRKNRCKYVCKIRQASTWKEIRDTRKGNDTQPQPVTSKLVLACKLCKREVER